MKVQLNFHVEEELKNRIDKYARTLTVPTAAFIRLACVDYIRKIEAQEVENNDSAQT